MRVREPQPGGETGLQCRRAQHQPLKPGDVGSSFEKARPEHHFRLARTDPRQHGGGIFDPVLAVGVEGDNSVQLRVLEGEFDPRLQGRSLPQINGVFNHDGACGACDGRGTVRTAVIDTDHVRKFFEQSGNYRTDDGSLVIHRHDYPATTHLPSIPQQA